MRRPRLLLGHFMSTPQRPSFQTLQDWLGADTKAFQKQEDFFRQVGLTPPRRITVADRQNLNHWDYSVIDTCKEHVKILETISNRTFEDKRVLEAIRQLITSASELALDAMELAEKLDKQLGPMEGGGVEGQSGSVVAPPQEDQNSTNDQVGTRERGDSLRSDVAVVGKVAPEMNESMSSDTDSDEETVLRWRACTGGGTVIRLRN